MGEIKKCSGSYPMERHINEEMQSQRSGHMQEVSLSSETIVISRSSSCQRASVGFWFCSNQGLCLYRQFLLLLSASLIQVDCRLPGLNLGPEVMLPLGPYISGQLLLSPGTMVSVRPGLLPRTMFGSMVFLDVCGRFHLRKPQEPCEVKSEGYVALAPPFTALGSRPCLSLTKEN